MVLASEFASKVIEDFQVEDQYEIAKALAANCGYQLVAEDDERSLKIKTIVSRMIAEGPAVSSEDDRPLIIEGLRALLK